MSIADNLGMPEVVEESAEDRMLLPIGVLYMEGGIWHTIYLVRKEVKEILKKIRVGEETFEFIEGRTLAAIRICEVEGPECNMQFIYDYLAKAWRLE